MKSILFLAAGQWQKDFLCFLKNKKYKITIVNPIENEITNLADEFIKCDVKDVKLILEKLNFKPDIITSDQCDVATFTISYLCKYFKIKGNSLRSILPFTNKNKMYEHCKKNKIKTPITKIVSCSSDVESFAKKEGYPLVIKPIDANASCGFVKLKKAPTKKEFKYAKENSFSKTVICQKHINGRHFMVEGFCSNYKHTSIAIGENKFFSDGVIAESNYPAEITNYLKEKIFKINDFYVNKSNVKFGITHSEYIVNSNGIYFIESGLRGGGNSISSKIVPWITGINLYDLFHSNLIGNKTKKPKIKNTKRFACIKSLNYGFGKVERIKIKKDISYCDILKIFIKEGELIKSPKNGKTRHGIAIILGTSKSEIKRKLEKLHKDISIVVKK